MRWIIWAVVFVVGVMMAERVVVAGEAGYWIYVGNYANGGGIERFIFDPGSGKLTATGVTGEGQNMNFLAVHPSGKFLYAVAPGKVWKDGGEVREFAVDAPSGELKLVNVVASGGPEPAHLAMDATGRALVVANYCGAGATIFIHDQQNAAQRSFSDLLTFTGHSIHPQRQTEPHPHGVAFNSRSDRVLIADLGTDEVYTCSVDTDRGDMQLVARTSLPPGSGPRHLVLGKDESFVYVINELSKTISVLDARDHNGPMRLVQTLSPWPADADNRCSAAEIALGKDGRYVYASNRGDDSIAVLAVDGASGKLSPVEVVKTGGKTPRAFVIDPTGRWLIAANQGSDTLAVFAIDPSTGKLAARGELVRAEAPVSLVFVKR